MCVIDEAQYQDIEHVGRVHQTMMATKGDVKIFGIGGEAGSAYERLWNETNQCEWHYDNPDWRSNLQFDHNGLIVGEYLKKVLSGDGFHKIQVQNHFMDITYRKQFFPQSH